MEDIVVHKHKQISRTQICIVLITLILWWIFWCGWGIGELGGFFAGFPFCISLVYFLGASLLFFWSIYCFLPIKKKKKKTDIKHLTHGVTVEVGA